MESKISPDESAVLIWDGYGQPKDHHGLIIDWQGRAEERKNQIKIGEIVERDASFLRDKATSWSHEIAHIDIGGKSLVDLFEVRPGLSYWWMTSIGQQFNLSDVSEFNNLIKCMALERFLRSVKVSEVTLVSKNSKLITCLATLCKSLNIKFHCVNQGCKKSKKHSFYSFSIFWALIYFCWTFFRVLPTLFLKPNVKLFSEVMFFDFLVHFDAQKAASGSFVSGYWGELLPKITEWEVKSVWTHMYFRTTSVPTLLAASKLLAIVNSASKANATHILFEQYYRLTTFLKAIKIYCKVRRVSKTLEAQLFQALANGSFDPSPFLVKEWQDTTYGKSAMKMCLQIALFEDFTKFLPRQKLAVYVKENQPWEVALLHFWREFGHGQIIGVPHSTIRFWDLRYHRAVQHWSLSGKSFPLPDKTAVNGKLAKRMLAKSGIPKHQFVDVEALRFEHLIDIKAFAKNTSSDYSKKIVVFGDFRHDNNKFMAMLLAAAITSCVKEYDIIYKPHPANIDSDSIQKFLSHQVSSATTKFLLSDCDIAVVGIASSVALEAYLTGVPVIQVLDGGDLNMSPLMGLPNVNFARSVSELAAMLQTPKVPNQTVANAFNFDAKLNGWKKVLCP